MIITAIGHGPGALGALGEAEQARLVATMALWAAAYGVTGIVTGHRPFADEALADAAVREHWPIEVIVAHFRSEWDAGVTPFRNRNRVACMARKHLVLQWDHASDEHIQHALMRRIDLADIVFTFECGLPGNTLRAIEYAQAKGKQIVPIWSNFYG